MVKGERVKVAEQLHCRSCGASNRNRHRNRIDAGGRVGRSGSIIDDGRVEIVRNRTAATTPRNVFRFNQPKVAKIFVFIRGFFKPAKNA